MLRSDPLGKGSGSTFRPVERERVLARLEAAAALRVVLVAAPAGYGKTLAVRQFLDRLGADCIQYCVRPEDDTLLGFVRGLIDAFPAPLTALRDTLGNAYASADRDRPQRLASWLADRLAGAARTIFVDDVHRVQEGSESAAFLASLVACSGPLVRWVFAGRDVSALPVASWVAYGTADLPLEAAELNFTRAESYALAASCTSALTPPEVDALIELTEGWSTAVALGVKAAVREREFAKSKATTRVLAYSYLAEQVFGALSDEQRAFLLETAVYTVVDLGILGVVEGQRRRVLAELRKNVTFIIDEGPDRFRYHDLFRGFLLDELRVAGAGRLEAAYRTAAATLESAGRAAEAMLLYARCDAPDDVVRLLHAVGRALVEHGQADVVERALSGLAGFSGDPHLLALRASVDALASDFAASEARYREALRLASGGLRAEIAYRFATDLLKRGKSEALDVLRDAASSATTPELRASVHGTLATAFALHDDAASARKHIDVALAESGTLDAAARATVLHQASYVAYQRADAKACLAYADSAAHLAAKEALRALEARIYRVKYGAATGFLDDRAQGAVLLAQMIEVARQIGDVYLVLWALAGSYDLAAERGDADALAALDVEIAAYDAPARREFDDELASARALRSAWSGDFANAAELLRGTEADRLTVPRRALRFAEHGVYAAAAGLGDDAAASLGEASRLAGSAVPVTPHDRRRHVQCLAYVVLGYAILGQYPRANAALRAAEPQRRGVPARYRLLLDAARGFVLRAEIADDELFRRSAGALERDGCGGLARMLQRLPLPDAPSESAIARLTPAEINVLRAIAVHGTSANAAEALGRSLNTVNVQVKSILKKLGCASRHEAVAYGREHGLIA